MYQVYNITLNESVLAFSHQSNACEMACHMSKDGYDYAVIDDTTSYWTNAYHNNTEYRYYMVMPGATKPVSYAITLDEASGLSTSLRFQLGSWPLVIDAFTGEVIEK